MFFVMKKQPAEFEVFRGGWVPAPLCLDQGKPQHCLGDGSGGKVGISSKYLKFAQRGTRKEPLNTSNLCRVGQGKSLQILQIRAEKSQKPGGYLRRIAFLYHGG